MPRLFSFKYLIIPVVLLLSFADSNGSEIAMIPTQTVFLGENTYLDLSNYNFDTGKVLSVKSSKSLDVSFDAENYRVSVIPLPTTKAGLYQLDLTYDGQHLVVPIRILARPIIIFEYQSTSPDQKISVAGNFNNWSSVDNPLSYDNTSKSHKLVIGLEPGRYEYKIVVDGNWILDPANPDSVSNGIGGFNSSLIVAGQKETPAQFLKHQRTKLANGNTMLIFRYIPGSSGVKLNPATLRCLVDNSLLDSFQSKYSAETQTLQIILRQNNDGKRTLRILAEDQNGLPILENVTLLQNSQPLGYHSKADFDWHDAIIYSLMVDRFVDGNPDKNEKVVDAELDDLVNYWGGDLWGLMRYIDEGYFNDLGVNALWILPINDNPDKAYYEYSEPRRKYSGYHGYWPIHHERIEPRFGKEGIFKYTVEKAHENNIKILVDFVSNHVHEDHIWFQEHPEWFGQLELPDGRQNLRLFDEYRLTTWFDEFLPSFDFPANPEAVEAVTDNALWWIRNFGIDGFRHDAVKHVPNAFWRRLTKKIKRDFPDREIYQIGETYGGPELINSYVNPAQMNAQFDFGLFFVMRSVFTQANADFEVLDRTIHESLSVYGPLHLMGNTIGGNHDQTRFITVADGAIPTGENEKEYGWHYQVTVGDTSSYQKLQSAFAFTMTTPGVPVIYYGDEFGMPGAGDPDNRRMMRFGNELNPSEKNNLNVVKQLCHLRQNTPALRYGDFRTLLVDDLTYAYARVFFDETIVVVHNQNADSALISIPVVALSESQFVDLMSEETFQLSRDTLDLQVAPYGFRILKAR